jgi:hypothetical protein
MRELSNDFDDFTAGNFRESRPIAPSLKVGQARVRVGKEAAHLPILRFGRRSAPEKKIERKGAKGPVHVLLTGTVLFFRKCAGEVTEPWATHRWHLASLDGDVLCYTLA